MKLFITTCIVGDGRYAVNKKKSTVKRRIEGGGACGLKSG